MCTEFPGPRCSNHARTAKEKAFEDLNEAKALHPADSLEVKIAERAYHEAVENYHATPDGLAELAVNSPELVSKYQKIRDYQVEALHEIRSGRFGKVNSLLAATQTFFDEEETSTILSSVRKVSEKSRAKQLEPGSESLSDLSEDEKKHHYLSILNHYENKLREAQKGSLTSEQMDTLTELRAQKPPKEMTSFEAYGQAISALSQSRESMRKEIQRIAVLQDVSPKIAGAYHDAYRKEYQQKYAHLPAKEQPNPPKEWVEGQYVTTGFQNDATTRLAPSDPATMYATYRLRSDMKSIPDYLKNSRNIATLSVENDNVNIILCNSKGKEIDNSNITVTDMHGAMEKLQGRIIVLGNDTETKNWLVSVSQRSNLKSSVLSTNEFSSKHFNLPDNSMKTFGQAMKIDSSVSRADLTMKAYLASKNKITSKWNSKAPRRHASPLDELPLASRWA